ncbi:MAG: cupredoxin family copper-binding protein [Dehalococcoidia bacterium]|jgi:plastocyanin
MRSGRAGLTVLLVALIAGGLFGAACGSSSNSATATPQKTAQPAATSTKAAGTTTAPQGTSTAAGTATAQGTSVTISDYQFTPGAVTIKVGDTVTWTNDGPSTHTVTADDGSFDSGNLSQGKTYSHTFNTAGTVDYHCSIHPNMKAQVIVQPSSGSSSSNPGY